VPGLRRQRDSHPSRAVGPDAGELTELRKRVGAGAARAKQALEQGVDGTHRRGFCLEMTRQPLRGLARGRDLRGPERLVLVEDPEIAQSPPAAAERDAQTRGHPELVVRRHRHRSARGLDAVAPLIFEHLARHPASEDRAHANAVDVISLRAVADHDAAGVIDADAVADRFGKLVQLALDERFRRARDHLAILHL
jgi:hypothetical protein